MIRIVGLAAVIAAALACAVPSSARINRAAQDGADTFAYSCPHLSEKLTYVFWPNGHELPSVMSSPFRQVDSTLAYVSVYRVGASYPDANWMHALQVSAVPADTETGFVGMEEASSMARPCVFGKGPRWESEIAHRKTTRRAIALTCRAKYMVIGVGQVEGSFSPAKWKVRAHDKTNVFLEADTRSDEPKLKYNAKRCSRVALPK